MKSQGLSFHHPIAFWSGCVAITAGVLSHIPMFVHARHMNYHMAGMPMDTTMLVGMALIPLGLLMALYGLMPRLDQLRSANASELEFHVADQVPLNPEHWSLVGVLLVAVIVDVMKPATLGFVMPGMTKEYDISSKASGTLALVALTGTAIGSVVWGIVADMFGRRAAILLSALMFISTAICGAMPVFSWNLVMCFLMGLSAGGLLPITFTLMAESIPAVHRGWLLVALGGLGTAAGYLVAAGAAALLEPLFSWRILWMLGLPTGLLLIFLNRYIPESPRYLAGKGLYREARQVLLRFNGNPSSNELAESEVIVEKGTPRGVTGLRQLLSEPYTGITIGLVAAGLAWGLVNFGFLLWLPTNLGALGLAEQANSIIAQSAIFALPGVGVVIWLYHRWSSIKALVLFIVITGLALLLFPLFYWFGSLTVATLSLSIALLLVSASGIIAMLIPYAAEIYPVQLRGTGAGLVAGSSKFGGILGAIFGVAGVFDQIGFSAILITLALLVSALLLIHNGIDTRGKRLEDVQADIFERSALNNK